MWQSVIIICITHLFCINCGPKWLFYATKPLPILLMLSALFLSDAFENSFGLWIMLGLLLSVLGDLFLMHPKDKFMAGLSCFLLAHLAYSIGFFQTFQQMSWWILFGFIATGILIYLLLLPNLDSMALPVGAYILVIAMMASTAAGFWLTYHNTPALLALTGALMFILSDLVLAIDRFRSSSHFSQHVIMVTYYSAQGLITLSVLSN